jgi:hypothetical protein
MTHPIPSSNSSPDKTINHEQFNEITEAILAGKYSWACFLLLRCAGYNPLHYIPYRTYNRLVKENSNITLLSKRHTNTRSLDHRCSQSNSNGASSRKHLSKISDLDYIETVNDQHKQVRGGYFNQYPDYN